MMTYIDLRLTGTEEEIMTFVGRLGEQFDVVNVSKFYANRGRGNDGRVYVQVRVPTVQEGEDGKK